MRRPRPLVLPALALALIVTPAAFVAAEELKVEVLKEAPPADLAPEIKAELLTTGYRVTTPKGRAIGRVTPINRANPAATSQRSRLRARRYPHNSSMANDSV